MFRGIIPCVLLFTGIVAWARQEKPEPKPATIRVAFVSPLTDRARQPGAAEIFRDDFDQAPDRDARYLEVGRENGNFTWTAGPGYGGLGGAMKCQFEKGQVSAGSLKVLFGKNPLGKGIRSQETFREIYWRVYVKHEPGWEGNPAKLGRTTCLAGSDWSQGFIAHVWGGKGDALCIDPATGIRDGRKVSDRYNDFAHLRWLGLRQGPTPIFSPAESGRWVCVESHVRLNTPGKSDGVFELWVDGRTEACRGDLDWHGVWNDYAIDAVFLENYWNQGAVKREARWFDSFVISTQPIGPVSTTASPIIARTAGSGVLAWEAEAASDPDGKDLVWTSNRVAGNRFTVWVDSAHGSFTGSLAGKKQLAAATYWVRLRERNASGAWSEWSAWHSPFRATP